VIIDIQNTSESLKLLAKIPKVENVRIIPEITLVRKSNHKKHCFSVCLYKEKTYAERFPERNFENHYLNEKEKTAEFIRKTKSLLRIFTDEEMLDVALQFENAEVFLVKDKPQFPFQQHIWRYYSVLFPDKKIKAHHFRGLDNVNKDDLDLINSFVEEYDLLASPYFAGKLILDQLIPVRGSCSVANNGIKLLAEFLQTKRPSKPDGHNKRVFHNDELFLREWWMKDKDLMNVYFYVDRIHFQEHLNEEIVYRLKKGLKTNLKINIDPNGPMRSRKKN